MKRNRLAILLGLLALPALAGCPTRNPEDGGVDAPSNDTPPGVDSGTDGGTPVDTGGMTDGGGEDVGMTDGGGSDGGMDDGGMPDGGGVDPCVDLTALRAATPGTVSLPASGVVTYLRPVIGTDPAGFFVQCAMTGPAIFVAIDPSTLTPAPAVGDQIHFTATELLDAAGTGGTGDQMRVTMLSDLAVDASGVSLTGFDQDLSAATDVVSALDDYESELVTITGTIENDFVAAGAPHRRAQLTTAGLDDAGLVIRVADTAIASLGLRVGCEITVGPSPLWRFDASAQVMGYDAADITVLSCPTPPVVAAGAVVVSEIGFAFAGSDNDLEFVELFNPSSTETQELGGCILSDAGGNELTLSALSLAPGGYAVIGGSMSETTPDQILPATFGLGADDSITLTCDTTVVDLVDWGASPFPAGSDDVSMQLAPGNTASTNDDGANWCLTPPGSTYGTMSRLGSPGAANPACPAVVAGADVRINELNANITGGCDLIELRVISGGSMAGFQLQERGSGLVTFPAGFSVATNDLIVVHMGGNSTACNGGTTTAPADETASVNEVPASSVSTNYDGAFDFYSTDPGITATDNVIGLVDATGGFVDVVLVAQAATGTAAAGSESAAATAAAAGEWTMVGGGIPAGGFVDDDFRANAVLDLDATGSAATGESIQRNDDLDSNSMTGWTQTASSFGAINAGQTAL